MTYVIGSARVDENGKYQGGAAGDQKQKSSPDYSGEVSRQNFYIHSKGWVILRAKDAGQSKKIAAAMATACDNPNIGYSQSARYGILTVGTATKTPTNADCSSLVRQCVKEATGKDPGDFTTGTEATKLIATGLFDKLAYTNGAVLYVGDILVTKTKGHTVVVIDGEHRSAKKAIDEDIVSAVLAGKYGTGEARKKALAADGYDAAEVQKAVNAALKTMPKRTSDKGIAFIKLKEGCRLKAYRLAGETHYTIGVGHHGPDVLPNMTISDEQATALLKTDLAKFEKYVLKYVTDIPLNQNRFDALVSYTFNRGPGGLMQLSNNCHTIQEYADGLVTYWGSATRYKNALIKRRKEEREMFLS